MGFLDLVGDVVGGAFSAAGSVVGGVFSAAGSVVGGVTDMLFGDSKKAERINNEASQIRFEANRIYNSAKASLEAKKKELENTLLSLGNIKKRSIDNSIKKFLVIFRAFKNIELKSNDNIYESSAKFVNANDIMQLRQLYDVSHSDSGTRLKGAATGALMSLAAGYGLTALGTTAAIGGASGLAAAAGGVLLSNPFTVIAALGVGNYFSNKKQQEEARYNLAQAEELLANAKAAAEEMKTIEATLEPLIEHCAYVSNLVQTLDAMFNRCNILLEEVVYNHMSVFGDGKINYDSLAQEEKNLLAVSRSMAGALKSVIDMRILTDEGQETKESVELLHKYHSGELSEKEIIVRNAESIDYTELVPQSFGNKIYKALGLRLNPDLNINTISVDKKRDVETLETKSIRDGLAVLYQLGYFLNPELEIRKDNQIIDPNDASIKTGFKKYFMRNKAIKLFNKAGYDLIEEKVFLPEGTLENALRALIKSWIAIALLLVFIIMLCIANFNGNSRTTNNNSPVNSVSVVTDNDKKLSGNDIKQVVIPVDKSGENNRDGILKESVNGVKQNGVPVADSNEKVQDNAKKESTNEVNKSGSPVDITKEDILWNGVVNGDLPLSFVHSGPGDTYQVIRRVSKGTKVSVLDASGSWVKIKYEDVEGWCPSNQISKK